MFMTAIIAVMMVGLIGLGFMGALRFMQLTNYNGEELRISVSELAAAMAAVALTVTPLTLFIGNKMAVAEILEYQEFYNGVEVSATEHPETCRAGHAGSDENAGKSNCHYVYDSGDYSYTEYYWVEVCSPPDKDGRRSCHQEQKSRIEWADIYSPYATKEYRYSISDSLGGTYKYPTIYLASNPEPATSKGIPSNYPRGAPADWLDSKSHLDSGDPRPVTRVFEYDNYILASKDELLKANDVNVEKYRDAELLPDHTASILGDPIYGPSHRQAKKVSFVGVSVADQDQWQDALMRFNAPLGSVLQGDLHVVLIDSTKVPRDDGAQYVQALKAYWQSEHFKKRAISKNGVILAIGTHDDKTIDWANATTGMPYGNNVMLESMSSSLTGKPLDPDVIFGKPRLVATPDEKADHGFRFTITNSETEGVLESVMFDKSYGFKRPCMKSCEDGEVGYSDLINKIEPTKGQKAWMVVIICFISLFFWWFVAATSYAELSTYYRGKPRKKNKSDHNDFERYMEWSKK